MGVPLGGPPPKPTRLKLLQGNPGRRPLPKNEPHPQTGIPTRPHWLLPEAKREWTRIVPELNRLGLLAKIDRALISMWCQCWALCVDAVKDIRKNGTTFVMESGYEGQRPSVSIMNKMIEKMIALSARFGLTPSDRSRISLPEPQKEDDFSEYMKRAGVRVE